ncbi:ABC transporter family protein, partial [Vibrio parahaemolyticus V-223/04]
QRRSNGSTRSAHSPSLCTREHFS